MTLAVIGLVLMLAVIIEKGSDFADEANVLGVVWSALLLVAWFALGYVAFYA